MASFVGPRSNQKRRREWELTLLALMSGNIISSVGSAQWSHCAWWRVELISGRQEMEREKKKEWNKSECNLLYDKGEIFLKIVCFNNWIKARLVECIFFFFFFKKYYSDISIIDSVKSAVICS